MEDFILAKSKRCFCKAVAAAFLSTGLCLSAFPAIAAPASDASSTVFPQIQKHLREVATMTAHFVQVDRNGQALDGSLTLKNRV